MKMVQRLFILVFVLCIYFIYEANAQECITDLSVRAKSGKVQLTWTHVEGTDKYIIMRRSDPASPFESLGNMKLGSEICGQT
ncbi:MAG: hypothetical protein K8F52_18270 [Candidatus Scalindua rubra]|uniref:Uncharacterized protein n=1 Tax=Candidatus Scalindua brodae TaxID=237368 RepID=A0A0B0EJ57_9BACT|nr:MAG: hypothetical protein SCABRO_03135 [Candidatus Scalindua brodae]MBZ0110602.1 hypothetical protein [Candidatus Scalindua rubra]TWU34618.1 hypothetical protein S225a_09760 [Candidatus Brocadiaceae bacterium S225]